MTPQLLIAGHIVKDIEPNGWQAGGGALYASAQAAKLGIKAGVVTACERDVHSETLVSPAEWHVIDLLSSIRFKNTYAMGRRTQRVQPSNRALTLDDVPAEWRDAPLMLLTPVFHDVSPSLPGILVKQGTIVGLGAQGWLRRAQDGRVLPGVVETAPEWLHGDVVFVSEEDVEEPEAVSQWQARVPTVVLTRGRSGYTIWHAGGRSDIATAESTEKDATGAGDVFATAYLVRYGETHDALEAARFASVAAAISVEGSGIESVANREQIEARLSVAAVSR
jgi:hypothetical protein